MDSTIVITEEEIEKEINLIKTISKYYSKSDIITALLRKKYYLSKPMYKEYLAELLYWHKDSSAWLNDGIIMKKYIQLLEYGHIPKKGICGIYWCEETSPHVH